MYQNGVYVGLGEGDSSQTVADIKAYLKPRYTPARQTLDDGPVFTPALTTEVIREQVIFESEGRLPAGSYIPGVINLATKYAMGYLKPPPAAPPSVTFTVEGHMSNMYVGPTASVASTLENAGRTLWRPTGYDCLKLPFNNPDGVEQLRIRVASTVFDDGKIFPAGTPWNVLGFSQGAMVVSDFMRQHVLPTNGSLHWRLSDFNRGLCFGNPDREFGKCASWAPSPPPLNTGGIMLDDEFVTTGTVLEGRWRESSNKGDMFSSNTNDPVGLDKAAIAKIVTQDSWIGGPVAVVARVLAIMADPLSEGFNAIKAAVEAIVFLASNPNPHYTTVATQGDIDWIGGYGELAA